MSSTLVAALFIGCPLTGAVCALLGRYTRWWQVLFGAVVGTVALIVGGLVLLVRRLGIPNRW